jgi:hypothetical protein
VNLAELKITLTSRRVPPDAYCLTGGLPNEAYCIERGADGKWNTYYSERGLRTGLKAFDTEEDACDYFFNWIVKDLSGANN